VVWKSKLGFQIWERYDQFWTVPPEQEGSNLTGATTTQTIVDHTAGWPHVGWTQDVGEWSNLAGPASSCLLLWWWQPMHGLPFLSPSASPRAACPYVRGYAIYMLQPLCVVWGHFFFLYDKMVLQHKRKWDSLIEVEDAWNDSLDY
jgi:hypothetical protein